MTKEGSAPAEDHLAGGYRAMAMFAVALLFLILLAAAIPHGGVSDGVAEAVFSHGFMRALIFGAWALIVLEGAVGFLQAPDRPLPAFWRFLLVALIPPFRLVISPVRPNTHVWLPRLGWLKTGKQAVVDMEARTAVPMLLVTALIAPVILADFLLPPKPHDVISEKLEDVTHFALGDQSHRLFVLDGAEVAVANFVRAEGDARQGIDGTWLVAAHDAEARTALSLGIDDRFTFRTGCAVTEGAYASDGKTLAFTGFEKTATCPPKPLEIAIYTMTALIWFSFAFEFILLLSLSEKKIDFCKRNWINIVIILLPLLAFLRSLQIFRVLRMAKAGKLMRAYRLRGMVTRVAKLAVAFNLIDRLMARNPKKYSAHLSEKIAEKEEELRELRRRLVETG